MYDKQFNYIKLKLKKNKNNYGAKTKDNELALKS